MNYVCAEFHSVDVWQRYGPKILDDIRQRIQAKAGLRTLGHEIVEIVYMKRNPNPEGTLFVTSTEENASHVRVEIQRGVG